MKYNRFFPILFGKLFFFASILSCAGNELNHRMANYQLEYSQFKAKLNRIYATLEEESNKMYNIFNLPANTTFSLGQGVNVRGKLFASALDENYKKEVENIETNFTSTSFTTSATESFDSKMSTCFNGSVEACSFEALIDHKKIQNNSENNNTVTFYQFCTYLGSKKNVLKNTKISQSAEKYLTDPNVHKLKDPSFHKFVEKYGTHYISGYYGVSSFLATVNVTAKDTASYNALSTTINAKLETFF